MKLGTIGTLITAASAIVLCLGASLTAERATAVWLDLTTPQSVAGYLTLESLPATPHWQNVEPGQPLHWEVTAALNDATDSTLELEIFADGDLVSVNGMTIEVTSCDAPFVASAVPGSAPSCQVNPQLVQPAAPLTAVASNTGGGLFSLDVLAQGDPRHLLVTLEIPSSVGLSETFNHSARIGIGLHAAGTPPEGEQPPGGLPPETPSPSLPITGADAMALGVLAAGSIGLACGVLLLRRARAERLEVSP